MNQDFEGLATHTCLKKAFAKEAGTSNRYLYFAKIAEIEGSPEAAQVFRDLAESSICNSHGTLDFLKRVGDPETDLAIGETDRNLTSAISAETEEYSEIYPLMQEAIKREGFLDIANWLQTLAKQKKVHVEKLKNALAQFNQLHGK
ncbi:MAG: rubrerythrin family protein [Proteobacteria bacterium]|nr:rubrerythrin family protein [Pseudomonadota bacterium]MBU1715988.1 rubrerythrin family protein [Pseudomonadota bacterium]